MALRWLNSDGSPLRVRYRWGIKISRFSTGYVWTTIQHRSVVTKHSITLRRQGTTPSPYPFPNWQSILLSMIHLFCFLICATENRAWAYGVAYSADLEQSVTDSSKCMVSESWIEKEKASRYDARTNDGQRPARFTEVAAARWFMPSGDSGDFTAKARATSLPKSPPLCASHHIKSIVVNTW